MSLNRELLKNIFDDMGYEVEFDSTTPGLCVEELVVEWTSDLYLNDIEESKVTKVKTSSIKNCQSQKVYQQEVILLITNQNQVKVFFILILGG